MRELVEGDLFDVLPMYDDAVFHAVVCDPPYHLDFMASAWDRQPSPRESQLEHARWLREVLRVLKPGGFLLAFSGTRTYHRLACAAEDVGFEVRDMLDWIYGSGFPKSRNVSFAIDELLGRAEEREVVGQKHAERYPNGPGGTSFTVGGDGADGTRTAERTLETRAATPEAAAWEGWGTALKPAHEPILLARKPLAGNVASNVLAHGTGALNIAASRVDYAEDAGRWPANVLLSHDDECSERGCIPGCPVAELDRQSGDVGAAAPVRGTEPSEAFSGDVYGRMARKAGAFPGDRGGASRFFYVAKASRAEREAGLELLDGVLFGQSKAAKAALARGEESYQQPGETSNGFNRVKRVRNHHPTVKPIELMRYLLRLVVPPGGVALDPFVGSGTTAVAAALEGITLVGIERDAGYAAIARARLAFWEEHGVQALEEMRRREQATRDRQELEDAGQLDLFA